jgi:hypothetical protein
MLGNLSSLQVHHIFPRAKLYAADYPRGQVNAIANFCFLTQDANLEILDRAPEDYFAEAETKIPGALESQWIPTDAAARSIDNYPDFLAARRELLASAANRVLDALISSPAPASEVSVEVSSLVPVVSDDELDGGTAEGSSQLVGQLVERYGLAHPELIEVVVDQETGSELGIADFYWPDGLQGAYDEPVVLVLEGDPGEIERMTQAGYRVFKSLDSFEMLLERRSAEMISK